MTRQPRRSIPAVLEDPRAHVLTPEQERTLLLLPLAMDDHGRALDSPGTLNGLLWGARWETHPPEQVDAELDALAAAGFLVRYEVDGVRCLQVLDWRVQQVISRPAPSLYPPPPHGSQGRRGPAETMWTTVESLVGVMSGAAEKLQDPLVQAHGVRLLSDLAGQIDPALARRVRERAAGWVGTAAQRQDGGAAQRPDAGAAQEAATSVWSDAAADSAPAAEQSPPDASPPSTPGPPPETP